MMMYIALNHVHPFFPVRWEEVLQPSPDSNIHPMTQLIEKLPSVAEIVLDNCITISPLPPSHEDFSVTFNFRHLDPEKDCVCFVPASMAKYRREKLLNHGATQAFLRYKWMVLGKFFTFFNTLVFIAFVALYSWFIVHERETSVLFSDPNSLQVNSLTKHTSTTTSGTIFVFVAFQFVKELVQLSWLRFGYLKDATNIFELVMYVLVCVFTIPSFFEEEIYSEETRWNAGLIGLFLCYLILTLHFRRYGEFGLYVTMYVEVLWTFVKVISTFIVALIGYSLVFYILLGNQVSHSNSVSPNKFIISFSWVSRPVAGGEAGGLELPQKFSDLK